MPINGTHRIAVAKVTLSKSKGKAFSDELAQAMNPPKANPTKVSDYPAKKK